MKPANNGPLYASLYPQFSEIFRKHGWALAVHGSVISDFDLIAVPWVEKPSEPDDVVSEIVDSFCFHKAGELTPKLHGRHVQTLAFDGGGTMYLDVSFTSWDASPQCEPTPLVVTNNELNIDAGTEQFELARALHRVVRAMHDGHCPKCGHLASSMEFEPSEGYHICPECEFAITKEESDEALAMFLPYMQKNYDKFVAWQLHGRFVKPMPSAETPLVAGDWVVCVEGHSDYLKEGKVYQIAEVGEWIYLDAAGDERGGWCAHRFRRATTAPSSRHRVTDLLFFVQRG
jgi:hypothetical protein